MHWHALTAEEALATAGSDGNRGLSHEEAERRLASHGPNALRETKPRPLWSLFLRQFASPLIYLLLVAAALAFALGEISDAVVIAVVVVVNAVVGTLQEGRAERSLALLRQFERHRAGVLRAGQEHEVDARDLVPGDILVLAAGDAIPADARVIFGATAHAAEAALTGESLPIPKWVEPLPPSALLADRQNMLYAGTHLTSGRARALVVGTGLDTEIGRISELASSAKVPATPLERRVSQFGRYVIAGAGVLFVAITAAGIARGMPFAEILMLAISQLVGMVPEGLPVAMTVALAVGVQRMARRHAIVRRLSAVETLGSTTVICTDKTGTLTRNEMTVTAILLPGGREMSVEGAGYLPEGRILATDGRRVLGTDAALLRLVEAGVLCSDAHLGTQKVAGEAPQPMGDPTEVALLVLALKAGIDPEALRADLPRRGEVPFDSATKFMATRHELPAGPSVVVKGAPEVVLPLCDGNADALLLAAEGMAARALRVLALASAPDTALAPGMGLDALRGRCTFLGLVGEIDPPRPEAAEAVRRCREAGIRPVMVTGDHKVTGRAIAITLGISSEEDVAVDGAELAAMSDADLDDRLQHISVFARVHPAQKLRIVEAYQKRGDVVAMTGDGVNDAPALVRADVGVAMGTTGTEVAKEAAKIVIADDNFATIVAAVEEGRVVYGNIKKVILLLFTTSLAEVIVLLAALVLGYPAPFAAVQILWNNLVTEGVITVNLIMEPAEGDEMRRRPLPPGEPLLTRPLFFRMALMTPAIILSTLGWFIGRLSAGVPWLQVQSETFTLLAVCEWFNVLNCRSETRSALQLSLWRNPWLMGGLVVGNLLQIAVVYWGPLGGLFHTVPFPIESVVAIGVVGSLVLWVEEGRKLVIRRRLVRHGGE